MPGGHNHIVLLIEPLRAGFPKGDDVLAATWPTTGPRRLLEGPEPEMCIVFGMPGSRFVTIIRLAQGLPL